MLSVSEKLPRAQVSFLQGARGVGGSSLSLEFEWLASESALKLSLTAGLTLTLIIR